MTSMFYLAAIFGLFTSVTANAENKKDDFAKGSLSDKKVLVVFFSHTGENYAVGNITKGNTHFIAEMIASETNGKLFEIKPQNAYPTEYTPCTQVAKKEKESGARPQIQSDIDIDNYDVIFIGYPNWWGDMPMPVYTFIEKHNWQGKTVIPFCTHEGSGLSNTESYITKACKGSSVLKGLAVKGSVAQNEHPKAQKAVQSWLTNLKY